MQYFNLPIAIAFGIATLQGLLVGFNLLLMGRSFGKANYFLVALTICVTLIIFQNFMIFSGEYKQYPHLVFPFTSLNGLIGPLFLFYVIYLVNPERGLRWYDLLHCAAFLFILYNQSGFLLLKGEYKSLTADYFYYGEGTLKPVSLYTVAVFRFIPIGYALYALKLINQRIDTLKSWSSDTNIQYLNRFKWIIRVALGVFISFFLISGYSHLSEIAIGRYEIYLHLLNSLIILALAVVTIQQPDRLLFSLSLKVKKAQPKVDPEPAIGHLKMLMESSKPYLDPQLKLHDLAKLTDTQPHVLSDQINREMKMNFYEFVNQYRVNEFKERVMLAQYEHLTLLAIGLDVGFNSKASFNRIFKKHTGMTPSQFKASHTELAQ